MDVILSIGFSVTGFTLLLLIKKEVKNIANKFAIAILCLWFVRFLLFYSKAFIDLVNLPWLYFIDQSLFFLDGVFLYWYSKSLTKKKFSLIKESLHLLPFVISLVPTIILFTNFNGSELYYLFKQTQSEVSENTYDPNLMEFIFVLVIIVQNLIYLILVLQNAKHYDKRIYASYSSVDNIRLNWFPRFLLSLAFLLFLPLITYFINYVYPLVDLGVLGSILIISLVITATYFCLHCSNQLYANVDQEERKKKSINSSKNLNKQDLNELYVRLQEHMYEKKPYLNENLSLAELAEQIETKPTSLSSVIKSQANSNFYYYVNKFRIEEVKRELLSTDEQVIIIAYKNGFSSKSTFNKVFKDFTGCSPTEYRKNKSN